jgi:hypothetical protein
MFMFALIPGLVLMAGIAYMLHLSGRTSEEIILAKRTNSRISPRFTPVLIYQSYEEGMGRGMGFVAVGTLFAGKSGARVVTVDHLFPKKLGIRMFAFLKLQPLEKSLSNGIQGVLGKGSDLAPPGQTPDIAILEAGEVKPIRGYSDRTNDPEAAFLTITGFKPSSRTLTSLVSGEKVLPVGIARSPQDGGVTYYVVEYGSVPGESGTGFVDDEDRLYVLKGELMTTPQERATLHIRRRLGLVFGPLKIQN